MKIVSFHTDDGRDGAGVLTSDGISAIVMQPTDERGRLASPMKQLLLRTGGALTSLDGNLSAAELVDPSDVTMDVPVPDPEKIVAAPVNYRDHQTEMNQDAHIDALGVFLKSPSSLLAPGGTVNLPYVDRRFDQEGELAVVIGRQASHVPVQDALDYAAGYTCLLDMTMRGGEDRSTRKSFDTFTPMGPWLVTPDEVGPLSDLSLRCWVGGELRQDADLCDLIWGVPELISYASSVMQLEPGDVLTTGTPAGVGPVNDGQQIIVEIDRVGRLQALVSLHHAVPCPTRGAGRGPVPPATVTPTRPRVAEESRRP